MKISDVLSRRAQRAGAIALVGGIVASVLATGAATADAPPQRVLQSVQVDLGADGTIHRIDGTNVRRAEGEKASSDDASYEPVETADELPVRVQTSWRTAEGAGTDLRELEGHDGRVQIDVTVQNTTVRPERLAYDAEGERREQYALVGVPLTIVASADLGEDSIGRVVTSSDNGAPVTNGVLSQSESGEGQVQWAALLAPPQLAPTTTFSLVIDAEDFALPELDLGVRLGLAADTSIQGLIGAAFRDSGASQLRLESDTIELVGQVARVLADAGRQLSLVRQRLDFSSGTLGTRAIQDLTSSTQTVASTTAQLVGQLDALGGDLSSALRTTNSAAIAQLQQSVEGVRRLLGDTSEPAGAPVISGSGCTTSVSVKQRPTTVHGQLNEVVSQLRGLSGATGQCRDAVATRLLETIGSTDVSSCEQSTSAVCTIAASATELDSLIGSLAESKKAAKNTLDSTLALEAQERLAVVVTQVRAVQEAARLLVEGGSSPEGIVDSLRSLRGGVVDARQALGDSEDGLTGALRDLGSYAERRHAEVGATAEDEGSMRRQVAKLGEAICELKATSNVSDEDLRRLRALTTGTDCAGEELARDDRALADGLREQAEAWQTVANRLDPASDSDLAAAVRSVGETRAALKDALDAIDAAVALVGKDLEGSLGAVIGSLEDLYDEDDKPQDHPLNALVASMGDVVGNQDKVKERLDEDFDRFQAEVRAGSDRVKAQIPVVDEARRLSEDEIGTLFGAANAGLDQAATSISTRGKAAIDGQNAKLAQESAQFEKVMDETVSGALKDIDSSMSASAKDLTTVERLLTQDLRDVLADLGSRDEQGRGLLGIIEAQSSQTRASTARLGAANEQITRFGNVRGQGLGDVYLQQAQLQRALELQGRHPAFGLELPNGSQHVTVFSFHMGGGR